MDIISIISSLVLGIIPTLIWELYLRERLLPVFRRFNYRVARWLRKEPPIGELLRRLSAACKGDEKTIIVMKQEDHVGIAVDGCFEIIHSHLYSGWREYDIQFLQLAKRVPLPDDLALLASENAPSPPNNGKYRLYRYLPDSSERPALQIQLAPTDYFTTYPIQRKLFEPILPNDSGGWYSPFSKYGKGMLEFGEHPLPNIVCLHTIVVLSDRKLLITQRIKSKDRIDWQAGKWSCSFEEQMTVKVGEPRNDKTFFDTVYAGCQEELGLPVNDILEIRILSLVLESDGIVVDPIALVRTQADIDDIRAYWQLKAQDGVSRELRNVDQMDWSIRSVVPILRGQPVHLDAHEVEPDEWHATSKMRLLVSLFHQYGIEKTLQGLGK